MQLKFLKTGTCNEERKGGKTGELGMWWSREQLLPPSVDSYPRISPQVPLEDLGSVGVGLRTKRECAQKKQLKDGFTVLLGGGMHTFEMPPPNSILLKCRTNLVPTEVRRVEISKKKYDNKRNGYVLGWLKAVTSNPSILAVHFNSSLFFYFFHMGFPISFCSKWSRTQEFWKFLREFRNLPSSGSTITPEKGRPWKCAYYFCPHSTG